MSQIILDFGSGNTCKNNAAYISQMIDELAKIDNKNHEVIIKWQLFRKEGDNIPLSHECFDFAYKYALNLGYQTTASVFDLESLNFLLQYDVPFVKIANRRDLDWLIGEVPRKIPVYVSKGIKEIWLDEWGNIIAPEKIKYLSCISKYPAEFEEYENNFHQNFLRHNISDHTVGLELFQKYEPGIWEKHYKLNDSTGLDAGSFAVTPEELKEIL